MEEQGARRYVQTRHVWLKHFVNDFETNPDVQYTIHKWGMYYWTLNFILVTILFFGAPSLWLKWGLFITLIYSIYANWATDYGSMSAAEAAQLPKHVEGHVHVDGGPPHAIEGEVQMQTENPNDA